MAPTASRGPGLLRIPTSVPVCGAFLGLLALLGIGAGESHVVLKGFLLDMFSFVSKFNTMNKYYIYNQKNQ